MRTITFCVWILLLISGTLGIRLADATPYVTSFGYNKNGYQTSVTDANGKLTNYAVNYRGQTTKITDALLKDTLIEYSGCATCGSGDAPLHRKAAVC